MFAPPNTITCALFVLPISHLLVQYPKYKAGVDFSCYTVVQYLQVNADDGG